MGYCMVQSASQFLIKKENKEEAFEVSKDLTYYPSREWAGDFKDVKTLEEVMRKWEWETIENENGDIIDIHFIGEKSGNDLLLFSKIAPFVDDESFIQMTGEDGGVWRWEFKCCSCSERLLQYS